MSDKEMDEADAARLRALEAAIRDTHWMSRRYATVRASYAVGMYNDATRALLAAGVELGPNPDGSWWAADRGGVACAHLSEAEQAEARAALDGMKEDGAYDNCDPRLRLLEAALREITRRTFAHEEARRISEAALSDDPARALEGLGIEVGE